MKAILIIMIVSLVSCSTVNKARTYGAIGGAAAGAGIGLGVGELIDNRNGYTRESNKLTGLAVGTITGAITGAILANFFWNEDPENREMNQMILDPVHSNKEIPLIQNQDFGMDQITRQREVALRKVFEKIDPQVKVYDVDTEPLPDDLKDEIQRQKIIIYDLPEQTIHLKDGRTIIIKGTKAKEHIYEAPKR